MPTREQIEKTMKIHFETWNNQDKESWLANWRDDVVMFAPVGGPDKQGKQALEGSWENSFKPGHFWKIEPVFMQICENQAALHVKNYGVVEDKPIELDSIEIYWIDDLGKIYQVQTYFGPPEGRTLDPFFSQQIRK